MKGHIIFCLLIGVSLAGTATTTRYWDCSGGACGCGFGQQSRPEYCHSNAMFKAPDNNEHGAKFYGGAAISNVLGGDYWLGSGCGKCFKLTGTSNIPSYKGVSSTIVLKGTNYCPPSNSVCNGQAHFDIAAPGFDYPSASQSNTCHSFGNSALFPPQTCAYWMIKSNDPHENCNCESLGDQTLVEGCKNFASLAWNNPKVEYEEVTCPQELVDTPPCWEQNGEQWPSNAPDKCAGPSVKPESVFQEVV